ncbi:MAG: hypothetical protein ABI551_07815 [Polyangiaceae bacterium]
MTTKSNPQVKQSEQKGVEGEGSYEGTRRYDSGLQKSVQKGNSEKLGKEAEKALEGPEGDELRKAEEAGKMGKTLK